MKNQLNRLPKSEILGVNIQQNQLIRLPVVKAMTGKSKSAIYNDIKAGTFPTQIKIGERASAWSLAAVQKWVDDKINQSEVVA